MRPTRTAYRQKGKRKPARRRSLNINPAIAILGAAIVFGGAVGAGPTILTPGYSESLSGCSVTDGDTIQCSGERIRLLGIDAPEMPGHCGSGRICAPGDPLASTSSLSDAIKGYLRIERVGEDRYGRTLAAVTGAKGDLSCWQLEHDQAIYKPDWDNGMRIARTCPKAVL